MAKSDNAVAKAQSCTTHAQVAFFIPNLIGYARFISLAVSAYYAFDTERWHWFVFWYGMSYFLDALDGAAARRFDQCSRYGSVLDMVCDRSSNAMIYMILAALWTEQSFAFYLCLLLDFGSHWLQF